MPVSLDAARRIRANAVAGERSRLLAMHLVAWETAEKLAADHAGDLERKAYWVGRAETHFECAALLRDELGVAS